MSRKTFRGELDFKPGEIVKPVSTSVGGGVNFVNVEGTAVFPTEQQCNAYGYTWDKDNQICKAYDWKGEVTRIGENTSNIGKGNNTINNPVNNSIVAGNDNRLYFNTENNLVNGQSNVIAENVSNSRCSGMLAEVTANNSVVQGGNTGGDVLGERQAINLIYGLTTTNGNTKSSYLNNQNESFFIVPNNTAIYFHCEVLALHTGGTGAGNPGDYASWLERGVVLNKNGVLSIKRTRKAIASEGSHTSWRPTAAVSVDGKFKVNVRGGANQTIEWVANCRLTQVKAGIVLSDEPCPAEECPEGYVWNTEQCKCQYVCPEQTCPEGYTWSSADCECLQN